MSMDGSGKIVWAHHSELQQVNLKVLGSVEVKDGERLPVAVKDMGSCEIYPQNISHNPNGRSVVRRGRREGGREGGREGEREGGREGGREGKKERERGGRMEGGGGNI